LVIGLHIDGYGDFRLINKSNSNNNNNNNKNFANINNLFLYQNENTIIGEYNKRYKCYKDTHDK